MGRCGQDLLVRNGVYIVDNRRFYVRQRTDRTFRGRADACSDGSGAVRLSSPTLLQFIERRVEFPPLAPREEPPLQCVLQAVIILALSAPGDFGAGPADVESIEN